MKKHVGFGLFMLIFLLSACETERSGHEQVFFMQTFALEDVTVPTADGPAPLEASMLKGDVPDAPGLHTLKLTNGYPPVTIQLLCAEALLSSADIHPEIEIVENQVMMNQGGSWRPLIDLDILKGEQGDAGVDGRSIVSSEVTEEGELIIHYSDDTVVNLGVIKGEEGTNGQDGADGASGEDGIGITSVDVDDAGYLTVEYSDGTTTTSAFSLIGPSGADGQDGTDGASGKDGNDGRDGIDGVSIASMEVENGALVITLSNGESEHLWLPAASTDDTHSVIFTDAEDVLLDHQMVSDGDMPVVPEVNSDGYWHWGELTGPVKTQTTYKVHHETSTAMEALDYTRSGNLVRVHGNIQAVHGNNLFMAADGHYAKVAINEPTHVTPGDYVYVKGTDYSMAESLYSDQVIEIHDGTLENVIKGPPLDIVQFDTEADLNNAFRETLVLNQTLRMPEVEMNRDAHGAASIILDSYTLTIKNAWDEDVVEAGTLATYVATHPFSSKIEIILHKN